MIDARKRSRATQARIVAICASVLVVRDARIDANERIGLKKSNSSRDAFEKNSCSSISLRVKSGHCVRRSMRWSNKQPSTSDLNSDRFSSPILVNDKRRSAFKTIRSCGVAPTLKKLALQADSLLKRSPLPSTQDAGPGAGVFCFRSHDSSPARAPAAPRHRSRAASPSRVPVRTEFISVNGLRTDRSALRSELRLKRISGPAAATGHPYAPMNSPLPHWYHEQRVSFSTLRLNS